MELKFFLEIESQSSKLIVPDKIRLTSSKNSQTATLTLIFFHPSFLVDDNQVASKMKLIKSIYFIYEDQRFSTKEMSIVWLKGRPLALEIIFLITRETDCIKLKKLFEYLAMNNLYSN